MTKDPAADDGPEADPLPEAAADPAADVPPVDPVEAASDDTDVSPDDDEVGAPPHGALAAGALPGGAAPDTVEEPDQPATEAEDAVAIPATHPEPAPAKPTAPPRDAPVASRTAKGGQRALQATRAAPVGGAPTEQLFTRRKEPALLDKGKAASGPALRAEAGPDPARRSALMAAAMAPGEVDFEDEASDLPPRARTQKPRTATGKSATFAQPAARTGLGRYTALILTGLLLLALLIAGFWASTLPNEGISWLWGGDEAVAEVGSERPADTPAIAPIAVPERVVIDTPPAAQAEPSAPRAGASDGNVTLASVETDAPAVPEQAQVSSDALSAQDDQPPATVAPPLPVVRAISGGILTPAEADRIYAATGVYQRAPRIPVQPRTEIAEATRPQGSVFRPVPQVGRPGAIQPVVAVSDTAMESPISPPPLGVKFEYDRRGRILATPEGTILPGGVVIYAGTPELRPRPRPGTPEAAPIVVGEADPDRPEGLRVIAGPPPVQPRLRPEGLAPVSPETASAETPDGTEAETAADDTQPSETGTTMAADAANPAQPEGAADSPAATAAAERQDAPTPGPVADTADAAPENSPTPSTDSAQAANTETPAEPAADTVAEAAPDASPSPAAEAASTDPAQTVDAAAAASDTPENATVVRVVQGAPDRRPTLRPADLVPPLIQPAPAWLVARRPPERPEDLAPPAAVAEAPAEPVEEPAPDINAIAAAIAAAAEPSSFVNRTARAVGIIRRPNPRPRDFARVVARASVQPTRRQSDGVVQRPVPAPATSAPATARPVGTPPSSVARAATQDNVINLRQMNLIGVYGRPNARRALVRLGNGRYVKVEVGSALDGGRVTAIGDNALNFVKGGRTYALQLPTG